MLGILIYVAKLEILYQYYCIIYISFGNVTISLIYIYNYDMNWFIYIHHIHNVMMMH